VSRLTFEWSANGGTFTGTGASVRWRAPAGIAVPAQLKVTVKVTEPTDGASQSVSSTVTIRVHDSIKEISDLSVQFLLDFSDQPELARVRRPELLQGLSGARQRAVGRAEQPAQLHHYSSNIGTPTSATVNFGGTCPFRNKTGVDGCVQTPVMWKAIDKRTGLSETSAGTDQTTAVYRESRWWLCDSDFDGTTTRPFSTFIR